MNHVSKFAAIALAFTATFLAPPCGVVKAAEPDPAVANLIAGWQKQFERFGTAEYHTTGVIWTSDNQNDPFGAPVKQSSQKSGLVALTIKCSWYFDFINGRARLERTEPIPVQGNKKWYSMHSVVVFTSARRTELQVLQEGDLLKPSWYDSRTNSSGAAGIRHYDDVGPFLAHGIVHYDPTFSIDLKPWNSWRDVRLKLAPSFDANGLRILGGRRPSETERWNEITLRPSPQSTISTIRVIENETLQEEARITFEPRDGFEVPKVWTVGLFAKDSLIRASRYEVTRFALGATLADELFDQERLERQTGEFKNE